MTRFHELRETLGWSMDWIAGRLGIKLNTVRAWNSDRKPPNDRVMAWMERRTADLAADPFPEGFAPAEESQDAN
jgi:ribosome-binding protein aMBF1 (putative translation factor)